MAAALMSSGGVASADAPIVTITSPTASSVVTYPSTISVTGTVGHVGGSGENINLCAVGQLKVTVSGTGYEQVIGNEPNLENPNGTCTDTVHNWSFPWNTPGVGEYTITATAKHGGLTGTDMETVMVTAVVTVEHPAAPAVANDLLDGSLKGKKHGACISAVAHHMGSSDDDQSGTDFSGVAKSDVDAYRAAVDDFLDVDGACRR